MMKEEITTEKERKNDDNDDDDDGFPPVPRRNNDKEEAYHLPLYTRNDHGKTDHDDVMMCVSMMKNDDHAIVWTRRLDQLDIAWNQ